MRKDKNNKPVRESFGEALDLPLDMIKNISRITIIGNEKMLIENYKGIMEYEENILRFNNNINVFGEELKVIEITNDDVLIVGKFKNIEFEN